MKALKALVRFMAGTEFDFDIEISIRQKDLPQVGLGQVAQMNGRAIEGGELMLGWNSGLGVQSQQEQDQNRLIRIRVSE